MKDHYNNVRMLSRRLIGSASQSISCAVRFFGVLRISFWGFWAWRMAISVCEA